jgi:hypothetical protein
VCVVSANFFSVGAIVNTGLTANGGTSSVKKLDTDKAVLAYQDTGVVKAVVITVSGWTPTIGTPVTVSGASSTFCAGGLDVLSSSQFVVSHSTHSTVFATLFTVSVTTISVLGFTSYSVSGSSYYPTVLALSTTKLLLYVKPIGAPMNGYMAIRFITVSGSTLSLGTGQYTPYTLFDYGVMYKTNIKLSNDKKYALIGVSVSRMTSAAGENLPPTSVLFILLDLFSNSSYPLIIGNLMLSTIQQHSTTYYQGDSQLFRVGDDLLFINGMFGNNNVFILNIESGVIKLKDITSNSLGFESGTGEIASTKYGGFFVARQPVTTYTSVGLLTTSGDNL